MNKGVVYKFSKSSVKDSIEMVLLWLVPTKHLLSLNIWIFTSIQSHQQHILLSVGFCWLALASPGWLLEPLVSDSFQTQGDHFVIFYYISWWTWVFSHTWLCVHAWMWFRVKSWLSEWVHVMCFRICARGLSATIRYHNPWVNSRRAVLRQNGHVST